MILHRPHRVLLALVDVEHLSTAAGSSAVRVELVADGFHLQHVLAAHALVTALVEDDARVVAVVDDGFLHQFQALFPSAVEDIFLCITCWHRLNQSHTVAALDVLFPRADVHPANQVTARFYHQFVAVVAQPGRNAHAHARPLVGGALRIAVHHDGTVVEIELAFTKLGFAETGFGHYIVYLAAVVCLQEGLHGVEITISPAPEVGVVQESAHLHGLGFTWLQGVSLAIKMAHFLAVSIQNLGEEAERARLGILISYLRFSIHRYLLSRNIIVAAIDIGTRGLEIIVERKGLVELIGDVEEHVLRNTAIVGIEVLVVPLEALTAGAFTIAPGVIHAYGDDVLALYNIRCKVETACHYTILGISHFLAIEPDVGTEAHAFELNEILAVAHFLDMEVLAIPHDGVAVVFDGNLERLFLVEGTRQRNLFPTGIWVVCLFCSLEVAHLEQPSSIKIELCSFYCIHLAERDESE